MNIYIAIGFWDIKIISTSVAVLNGIKNLFGEKVSNFPHKGLDHLVCEIVEDQKKYTTLHSSCQFGPDCQFSNEVVVAYDQRDDKTFIKVSEVGIIELYESKPSCSKVVLSKSNTNMQGQAAPEAYMFPLLLEWLRNVGGTLLHCGGVVVGDRAVLLTGPSGGAKSTSVLRMVLRGVQYLAEEFIILAERGGELYLKPFQDYIHITAEACEKFEELSQFRTMKRRKDGKLQIDVAERFQGKITEGVMPGVILHLYPDDSSWIRDRKADNLLLGIENMNWFSARKAANASSFFALTELMQSSKQFEVSRGYLVDNLDNLLQDLQQMMQDG